MKTLIVYCLLIAAAFHGTQFIIKNSGVLLDLKANQERNRQIAFSGRSERIEQQLLSQGYLSEEAHTQLVMESTCIESAEKPVEESGESGQSLTQFIDEIARDYCLDFLQ